VSCWRNAGCVVAQLKDPPDLCMNNGQINTQAGLAKGKARVLQLEQIRTHSVTMTDILSARKDILEWWLKIA
jgi:hypothetical protein